MSILAALEGQPAAGADPTPRQAWPWAVGLGTLCVAVLATVLLSNTDDGAHTPVAVAIADAPQAALQASGSARAAAAALPAPTPVPQLAALETLAAAPIAPEAPTATAAAPATPATTDQTPKDSGARTNGTTRVTSTKQPDRRQVPARNSSATSAVAKSRPGTLPAATAPTAAASSGNDADVDLIAALMQHLSRQDAADGKAPTTIADLVGRCKGLAAADALRCQRRICDNYWGRAEACPRNRAPRAVAVRP